MAEIDYLDEETALVKINLVSLARKQPSCRLPPENRTFDADGDVTLIFTRAMVPRTLQMRRMDTQRPITLPHVGEVRYLVSSKHLSLASPVFKAMLRSGFSEGDALRAYGRVEIPLPEDCHDAFAVILNVVHGKPHLVPTIKRARPKLLANLAILLDKYQFEPIFEHFKAAWFDKLVDEDLKFTRGDRTILSFFGSCDSFKFDKDYLKEHLKIAWPYFKGAKPEDFDSPNPSLTRLPIPAIPSEILACLRFPRRDAINATLRMIDGYISGLESDRYCFCTSKCENFAKENTKWMSEQYETCNDWLHRSLLREATKADLWHRESDSQPLYSDLYKERSFESIREQLKKFDLTISVECDAGRRLKETLLEEMEEIEDRCDPQAFVG